MMLEAYVSIDVHKIDRRDESGPTRRDVIGELVGAAVWIRTPQPVAWVLARATTSRPSPRRCWRTWWTARWRRRRSGSPSSGLSAVSVSSAIFAASAAMVLAQLGSVSPLPFAQVKHAGTTCDQVRGPALIRTANHSTRGWPPCHSEPSDRNDLGSVRPAGCARLKVEHPVSGDAELPWSARIELGCAEHPTIAPTGHRVVACIWIGFRDAGVS